MVLKIKAPTIWSEIDDSFSQDAQGNVKMVYNVDAVKASVRNILGTRQGSRVMLPTFAETFSSMLFDPIDSHLASFLSEQVKKSIETWDNRVSVITSEFSSFPDQNRISVTVYFSIRGYSDVFQISQQL